jgi:DNA-directed RNA polymerase specialized sigma24 family protein
MNTVTSSAGTGTFEEYAADAWPALYRYAYLLTGNHADAEDIAQQTWLKAYRSWSRVRGSDSLTAYLRKMLTNTYLSQRRPKSRRLEMLTDEPAEPAPTAAAGPEERMVLWPHVRSLPPRGGTSASRHGRGRTTTTWWRRWSGATATAVGRWCGAVPCPPGAC